MPDVKDIVDALFFSRGEYLGFTQDIASRDVAWGWPRGSQVRLRIASTFTSAQKNAVRKAMDQLNDAVAGAFRVFVEDQENSFPAWRFESGQVLLQRLSVGQIRSVCPTADEGCMPTIEVGGLIRAASGAASDNDNNNHVASHEAAHGAAGLAHLVIAPFTGDAQGETFPWFHFSLMSKAITGVGNGVRGEFAPWELDAIRSVYGAGLGGGSRRSEFVARGLVNP